MKFSELPSVQNYPDLPYSCRAARNTFVLHHSIVTTFYHTDTMLTSQSFSLHTFWLVSRGQILQGSGHARLLFGGVGLFAEIGRVKFRKGRVEMQIWGKPAIFFSWTICLRVPPPITWPCLRSRIVFSLRVFESFELWVKWLAAECRWKGRTRFMKEYFTSCFQANFFSFCCGVQNVLVYVLLY